MQDLRFKRHAFKSRIVVVLLELIDIVLRKNEVTLSYLHIVFEKVNCKIENINLIKAKNFYEVFFVLRKSQVGKLSSGNHILRKVAFRQLYFKESCL
jgi:hypothetical protein